MIIDLLGFPTDEELEMFSDIKEKDLLRNIQKRKAQDFNKLFTGNNPLAIDMLKKMLTFDPQKRITVDEAL